MYRKQLPAAAVNQELDVIGGAAQKVATYRTVVRLGNQNLAPIPTICHTLQHSYVPWAPGGTPAPQDMSFYLHRFCEHQRTDR